MTEVYTPLNCGCLYLTLVVGSIRHVGKEGNELEAHRAGLVTEDERQLEYHDSDLDDLIAALKQIPTRVVAHATGYNPRTVRRLKRGEFRPSAKHQAQLLSVIEAPSCCPERSP